MTGKMLIIIFLGIALAVVVVNKFLTFREGLDNTDKDCCQKWVQTLNCKGDGPLDTGTAFKQASTGAGKCSTSIPKGASGYCLCKDGSKKGMVDCGHAPFTCNDVCKDNCTLPAGGCEVPNAPSVTGVQNSCGGKVLTSGEKCSIKCSDGYKPNNGTTDYSCNNGKLTSPTLACTWQKACYLPETLGAGITGSTQHARGELANPCGAGVPISSGKTCSVKCSDGYTAGGGTTDYSCNNGQLTAATLKCSKPQVCSLPKAFGTGIIGGDSTPCAAGSSLSSGKKCEVKCDTGYDADKGTTEYTCGAGSKLTPATLKCSKPKGCSLPKAFSTGVIGGDTTPCITGSLLSSGKKCDIKCDTGYKVLSGTKEYSCNNGAMTNGTLKCGPISCKIPASLGKGIRSAPFKGCAAGDSLGAGKTCSVECEKGYKEHSGTDAYSCSDVGVLSKASLECNPITCKLPTSFGENVEGTGDGGCEAGGTLLGGASCMTSCAPGYRMQTGAGTYSCSGTGILKRGDLNCVKIKKKKRHRSPKENIELTEENITQNITFICDPEESPVPSREHSLATYSHSSYSPAPIHMRGISSSGPMHRIPRSRSVKIPGAATVRPYDSLMNWR